MVIVEGPDGAGKSTLCKKLLEDFHGELGSSWYNTIPIREKLSGGRIVARVANAIAVDWSWRGMSQEVLYDRLFFSELVYGPVLRGSCAFTRSQAHEVVETLWGMKVPVIYCRSDVPTMRKNIRKKPQLEGVPEQFDQIVKEYDFLLGKGYWDEVHPVVYDYNYQEPSTYDTIHTMVTAHLESRKEWHLSS